LSRRVPSRTAWSRPFSHLFQLAHELSNAAQSLNRAAVAAERLARFVAEVNFEASASEQQAQFMAVLSATKDLQTAFSLAEAAGKKRRRKDKVAKDPDAPKKPITSYLFFQEAKRKEMSAKHPELPYKEVLKLLGVEWRSMSDADKEVRFSQLYWKSKP
jgi:Trm5-related predicted tRNA methylase